MRKLLSLVFVLHFALYSFCQTQSLDIFPSQDNSIFQEAEFSNAMGENLFAGNLAFGVGYARRGLIKFQIPSLTVPPGSTILSATLKLYCNKIPPASSALNTVNLYKATEAWGEGTSNAGSDFDGNGVAATSDDATWLQRLFGSSNWATAGGSFISTASAAATVSTVNTFATWSSAQMATDVQEWVNNPGNNFGWIIVANETVGKTVKRYSSRENSNPLNWPVLTITYTGAVPVMLNYFRGTENSKGMLLSWQTLAEYNNLGFDIQHSTDGLNFTSIGKLPGAGNNSGIKNYQFIHTVIDPGNHFYRLVQTDRDGKTSYSNIVNILTRLKHAAFVIYPNPVMDYFQVSGLKSLDNAAYQVFNASGMVITEGKLITNEINTAGLPKGFYMIKIKQATETGFGRFVKE